MTDLIGWTMQLEVCEFAMMSIATDQMTWIGELVDMKNHRLPVRQAKLRI